MLEYFELTHVEKAKMLHIYLEEKKISTDGYTNKDLESKGTFQRSIYRISQFVDKKQHYVLKEDVGRLKAGEQSSAGIGNL